MKKAKFLLIIPLLLLTINGYANSLSIEAWVTGQFFSKVGDSSIDILFEKNHTCLLYKTTRRKSTFTRFKFTLGKPKLEMHLVTKGTWFTNETENELIIKGLQGKSFVFKFIPPNDDDVTMLISGTLDNANIKESYVSVLDLEDDTPDYQGP